MADPTPTGKVVRNLRKRGITVLTHDQWKSKHRATYAARRNLKPSKRPADTCVQHITVTLDTGPLTGDFIRDVQTVERIGYERFKSGVSYNWVVDMETGMVAVGMPLDAKGTHTVNDKKVPNFSYDQNYWARAIAVLGMENTPLSSDAQHSIEQILAAMVEEGELTEGFDYCPHSKFAYKGCPCDSTASKMDDIRKAVAAEVKAPPVVARPPAPAPTKPRRKLVDAAQVDLRRARRKLRRAKGQGDRKEAIDAAEAAATAGIQAINSIAVFGSDK